MSDKSARMSLTEYREKLHAYEQRYLLCKDIRHVWQIDIPYTKDAENADWVYRTLSCQRCGTTRTDFFHLNARSNRLERGYSTYRYPNGFSMRGLPEASKLSEVMRFESYLRSMQGIITSEETHQ